MSADQHGYVVHPLVAPLPQRVLTANAKLVHAYATRWRVGTDRRERGGLEPGQVWLRVRQRREEMPGVDAALGMHHETVTASIRRLVEIGLLEVVSTPGEADRRKALSSVYHVPDVASALRRWRDSELLVGGAPVEAGEGHSPENPDCADGPENPDRTVRETRTVDGPENPDLGMKDGSRKEGVGRASAPAPEGAPAREETAAAPKPVLERGRAFRARAELRHDGLAVWEHDALVAFGNTEVEEFLRPIEEEGSALARSRAEAARAEAQVRRGRRMAGGGR